MGIDDIIKDIIKKEGGYVDDPKDRGGATKYGITLKTLSNYLHKPCTKKDVENLTIDIASNIYKKTYYYEPRIDLLPEGLQPIVTDMAVNSGPIKAISMLQEVLNTLGYKLGIPDGIIGNNTISTSSRAIRQFGHRLINLLVERRKIFYINIVKNDPTQKRFLNGWLARADSFKEDKNNLA